MVASACWRQIRGAYKIEKFQLEAKQVSVECVRKTLSELQEFRKAFRGLRTAAETSVMPAALFKQVIVSQDVWMQKESLLKSTHDRVCVTAVVCGGTRRHHR